MPRQGTLRVGLDARFRRRTDLRCEEVAGERIVLDEVNGNVHQLNASASFIWEQCDGGNSVADIVRRMVEHFAVDEEAACGDVVDAIEQFCSLRLVY